MADDLRYDAGSGHLSYNATSGHLAICASTGPGSPCSVCSGTTPAHYLLTLPASWTNTVAPPACGCPGTLDGASLLFTQSLGNPCQYVGSVTFICGGFPFVQSLALNLVGTGLNGSTAPNQISVEIDGRIFYIDTLATFDCNQHFHLAFDAADSVVNGDPTTFCDFGGGSITMIPV